MEKLKQRASDAVCWLIEMLGDDAPSAVARLWIVPVLVLSVAAMVCALLLWGWTAVSVILLCVMVSVMTLHVSGRL